MKTIRKTALMTTAHGYASTIVFWLTVLLITLVPLAFSTTVHRVFSLPKFSLLLTGAAALVPLLVWSSPARRGSLPANLFRSRHVLLVASYVILISLSTIFSAAPVASLFGSSYNQMGLMTHLCFFVCFIGLIATTGASERRMRLVLWAMAMTGLVVATYAYVQFFGRDPILPSGLYMYDSSAGPVVRVISTLGHSNYLGNFLLYVTPLSVGLALASFGRARRLALVITLVCTAALVFTGTRGAWIGLGAGAVTFVALELSGKVGKMFRQPGRPIARKVKLAAIALALMVGLIIMNPASRNIAIRAQSLAAEGFTGAGRTLLWRDSIRMVPDYCLLGCGPEAFRKAFLAYKSPELARLAPGINNESSHNSYIDSAVSYGLLGAVLYVAVITSSLTLLIGARRRAKNRGLRLIFTGLVSSLAAVALHNIFIFDQISTGLYFFAFVALAQIASNLVSSDTIAGRTRNSSAQSALKLAPRLRWPATLAGITLFVIAAWYSSALVSADIEINKAFASAQAGDFNSVVEHGKRAVGGPDPAGDYDFLFARALALCADRLRSSDNQPSAALATMRAQAIDMAMAHAVRSLAHALTPDSSNLLLAYLALQRGDAKKLLAYASEAVKWDPNFHNARWLLAEAFLAAGDNEQAVREASLALEINPSSREAWRALKRARGEPTSRYQTVEELITQGRALAAAGKVRKARRLLLRAARETGGPCAECHLELAYMYEAANLYSEAIAEWQEFARESHDRTSAEQALARIETLRQKRSVRR